MCSSVPRRAARLVGSTVALVIAAAGGLACQPAATTETAPNRSASPAVDTPPPTTTTAEHCAGQSIAHPGPELPASIQVAPQADRRASPWAPTAFGEARAPWLHPEAGLLVVPRPGRTTSAPARWDVVWASNGELLHSRDVPESSTLPAKTTDWMRSDGLLEPGAVALRPITVPPLDTRGEHLDPASRWRVDTSPVALGDADINTIVGVEIPGRCRWAVGVGTEAYSVSDDGTEIEWSSPLVRLWAATDHGVAVVSVQYEGRPVDRSGHLGPIDRHALAYRVLGAGSP